jgi:hypothetical protein
LGSNWPTVKWSGIQNVLERADSDILLLDCCHSGTANTNEGHGVTELISAGAYNTKANGVGPYSFTNALILELEALAWKRRFSTAELYNNIFCRIQLRMPDDDSNTERHTAPVHIVLTNDTQYRRSIHISKLPVSANCPRKENVLTPSDTLKASANDDIDSEIQSGTISPSLRTAAKAKETTEYSTMCSTMVPRLFLAIRFFENFRVDECAIELLVEWLRSFPLVAEQVKVEAAFDIFSSVWVVSIPISLYAYLEHHPAITCLGPITSSNKVIAVYDFPIEEMNSQIEPKDEELFPSLNQPRRIFDRRGRPMRELPLLSGGDEPTSSSLPPVPQVLVPGGVAGKPHDFLLIHRSPFRWLSYCFGSKHHSEWMFSSVSNQKLFE